MVPPKVEELSKFSNDLFLSSMMPKLTCSPLHATHLQELTARTYVTDPSCQSVRLLPLSPGISHSCTYLNTIPAVTPPFHILIFSLSVPYLTNFSIAAAVSPVPLHSCPLLLFLFV